MRKDLEPCPKLAERVSAEYWIDTWERTPLHGIYTVNRVIPSSLCRCIIQEAASHHFTTNRHKHFPTVDIPLRNLRTSWLRLEPILELDIYPLLKTLYRLQEPHFNIVDLFVVRYKTGQQVELGEHRDGSIISFNILLNSTVDFCGGGTRFPGLSGLTIRGSKGAAIVHCGKIKHSGVRITKGERMLLVGFINVVDDKTLLPLLSRHPLRSYSRDDDYLRGLWIGKTFVANCHTSAVKRATKLATSAYYTNTEDYDKDHDGDHDAQDNHNNKTSSSGKMLTCFTSRLSCTSANSFK
mgnify:CR=1 FL=1